MTSGITKFLSIFFVDIGNKRKESIEAFNGKDTADKGVENKLVKVIVYASSINALRHQCFRGTPRPSSEEEIYVPISGWIDGGMAVKTHLMRCIHAHSSVETNISLNVHKLN